MLELSLDIISGILIVTGVAFTLTGSVGLLRFPDFYSRLHGTGITDTMGAELVVIGLLLQAESWIVAVKLILVGLFLFITSPTATHAVAAAAYAYGLKPRTQRWEPEHLKAGPRVKPRQEDDA
jgi:multicomponent Na+:H+ antiporter subunit G